MSNDWYHDVVEFHREVMLDVFPTYPYLPSDSFKNLRYGLVLEEMEETLKALQGNDLVGIADGICDSIVVLLGTAVTYGIDIRSIWDEVHRTNMAKRAGPLREDGKRLKPLDWEPPKVRELLAAQGGVCQ